MDDRFVGAHERAGNLKHVRDDADFDLVRDSEVVRAGAADEYLCAARLDFPERVEGRGLRQRELDSGVHQRDRRGRLVGLRYRAEVGLDEDFAEAVRLRAERVGGEEYRRRLLIRGLLRGFAGLSARDEEGLAVRRVLALRLVAGAFKEARHVADGDLVVDLHAKLFRSLVRFGLRQKDRLRTLQFPGVDFHHFLQTLLFEVLYEFLDKLGIETSPSHRAKPFRDLKRVGDAASGPRARHLVPRVDDGVDSRLIRNRRRGDSLREAGAVPVLVPRVRDAGGGAQKLDRLHVVPRLDGVAVVLAALGRSQRRGLGADGEGQREHPYAAEERAEVDVEKLLVEHAELLSEVARRLAHEIKNPLTPIRLTAERLEMRLEDKLSEPDDLALLHRAIETITTQVDALKQMVNDFREYAKIPTARMEAVDLNAFLEEASELYDQAGTPIELKLTSGIPHIQADKAQLRQVLHNLVSNSIDAAEGDTPSISIFTEPLSNDGRIIAIRLRIEDNGVGFSESILAKAFEPYITTKATGTGLGLPMVKKILDEHQARIQISNRMAPTGNIVLGARVDIIFKHLAADRPSCGEPIERS